MSAPHAKSTCPSCSAELNDDYGMVNCPSCGAIVFVDMDGIGHISTPEPTAPQAFSMDEALGPPAMSQVETSTDPLDLSSYANSELSGAQDGPLVLTLVISGIDTKDLRDEIRQVFQDPRLAWDWAALTTGIKDGVIRVERIPPVKATIVVNRIKHLAVSIRWEQNAITDLDGDKDSNP